jgi:hypothetical protein
MPIANSIVVHQPHFLPWPPYLAKIALCENFVVQDDVQFRKGYFHNRTKLLDKNGIPHWITVPVHADSKTLLCQTLVAYENKNVLLKIRNKFVSYYQASNSHPSLERILGFIRRALYLEKTKSLMDLNVESIMFLLEILNIPPPRIHFASRIPSSGSEDRTDRLISIIKHCDAEVFVTGWGQSISRQVHDLDLLAKERIKLVSLDSEEVANLFNITSSMTGVSTAHWLIKLGEQETQNLFSRLLEAQTHR